MKWLARSLVRRVITITLIAFLAGYVVAGSVGSVASGASSFLSDASRMLGVSGFLDSIDAAVSDEAGGEVKKARAIVVHSVDGDTFDVSLKSGKEVSVRLLGIDSPESHRPGVPVEDCALDAAAAGKKLAEGKAVKLTTDPTQDSVDYYDRWLRYAKIGGKDYGLTMLKKGWVAPYVYDDNEAQKIDAYRKAAAFAESKGRGVWGKCGGNFHSADDESWSGD